MISQNKIQRVVEQCRKSHNGPVTTEEELDEVIRMLEDEESKRKAMIYEIRHRKFTLLSIKPSNPLFLQNKLSNEELEANLRMLLQKCGLNLVISVTMDDLESVILQEEISPHDVIDDTGLAGEEASSNVDAEDTTDNDCGEEEYSSLGPLIWPPSIGDHVTVNFDKGFKIGEITQINSTPNKVRIDFMQPKPFIKSSPRTFWVWGHKDSRWVHKDYVLPIHPVLELEREHSSSECVVFRLENLDVIQRLCSMGH